MNPNELKNIWAQQAAASAALVRPTPEIIWRLATESARFNRTIFWRDAREWAATFLLAGCFLYAALVPAHIHWPMVAAAIIACIPMTYVALRRKKRPIRITTSLADHLRHSIAEMQNQVELLRSVARWYLAPLAVSGTIFLADGLLSAPVPNGARKLMVFPFLLGVIVISVVFYIVWKLNDHVARKHLGPRLRELQQTLADVEKD